MFLNMIKGLPNCPDMLVDWSMARLKGPKKFMKGLKLEIKSKLIPLQLRKYLQAVEKALEVEIDI